MNVLRGFLMIAIFFGIITIWSCSQTNQPEVDEFNTQTLFSYAVVESDLEVLKANGINLNKAAGVFSIGWNHTFAPFREIQANSGHAFAVVFDESQIYDPRPVKSGIDIGGVSINYNDQTVDLQKFGNEERGFIYTLFPFGRLGISSGLEFFPDTEYEFEITGSEKFSAFNFSLKSPGALLELSSPMTGDSIDLNSDLSVTWEGGLPAESVQIRVMPVFHFGGEKKGMPHGGRKGKFHPDFRWGADKFVFELLDDNPGEYVIPADKLQKIAAELDTNKIILMVAQWQVQEISHNENIYHAVLRNGDSLILNVK